MRKAHTMFRAVVSTAVLALAALAIPGAGPAAAAPQHPEPGNYCTPKEEFYGSGGYIFTDAWVCLKVYDTGYTQAWVETDRNTYYWGASWWNSTPGYPSSVWATGTVSKQGEKVFDYKASAQQEARAARHLGGAGVLNECGAYTVTFEYHQTGAYHGSDRAIDAAERTYQVQVNCAAN
ncbi:hypothetical protein [Streptomyces sp. NPDC059479]|uniref:hypothetical protein n=1 Tax=Streptomyces sp. NPDC059479 TaxID=3346848 RepID=UPI0036AD03D7